MTTKSVPLNALRINASLAFSAAESDSVAMAPKSVTIVARTDGEAYQGYWGRCVHDMSGFIPPSGPVPLDYGHCDEETSDVIGVADTVEVVDGQLIAKGRLIPFAADDSASEVIYKGSQGVPYQASVNMDLSTLQVVEVMDGQSMTVNGSLFEGPGFVFTQWSINGIAILLYGADPSTSVQFSRGNSAVEISIKQPPEEELIMTEKAPVIEPVAGGEKPPITPVITAVPAENPDNFSRSAALKFQTDFGTQGFDWYLSGRSYEEASKMFGAEMKTKIDAAEAALKAKNDELAKVVAERDDFKKKSEFRRGQAAPVPVKPAEGDGEKKPSPTDFNGYSKGMRSFVESIKDRMHTQN